VNSAPLEERNKGKTDCFTLADDATLLTRNTTDFAQVAALKFANWLD